jgi:hypothetical protein
VSGRASGLGPRDSGFGRQASPVLVLDSSSSPSAIRTFEDEYGDEYEYEDEDGFLRPEA